MKKSVLLLVAAVLAALLLAGCARDVSGTVESSSTGLPIAGAVVRIGDYQGLTDSRGHFTAEGVDSAVTEGSIVVSGYPEVSFAIPREDASGLSIAIEDSALSLSVAEVAVEPTAVQTYTVTIDNVPVVDASKVAGLVPGDHTLGVESEGHETYETTITLTPGENSLTATLSLTPLETYKRFGEATKFHRTSTTYKYIHPDERRFLPLKTWAKGDDDLELKAFSLGDMRTIKSWKSKATGKTYSRVAQIDRSYQWVVSNAKYSDYGQTLYDNQVQHWVKKDGIWYLVHADKWW